jgi:hypothetical protein
MVTNSAEIFEANRASVPLHLRDEFGDGRH